MADVVAGVSGTATAYVGSGEVTDPNTDATSTGDTTATRYYTFAGATVAMRGDDGGLALMLGDEQGSTSVMMPVTLTASGSMLAATLADAAGVTRTSYTPYGQLRGVDNVATDRGWLGQVEDAGTGLTYLNARYYDPVLSRFLSPDPLMNPGDPRTLDAYRYAENNPIVFTDASGLRPACASGGAVDQDACFYGTRGVELNPVLPGTFGGLNNREYDRGMNGPGRPLSIGKSIGDGLFIPKLAVNFLGGALNTAISAANVGIWWTTVHMGAPTPQIPSVPVWDGDSEEFGAFYYFASHAGSATAIVGSLWLPGIFKGPKAKPVAPEAAAASSGRAVVDADKYDYLFGKVASNAHNAARSAQNAQQLARVGVYDNAAGRSLLSSHFDDVVADSSNIVRTFTNDYGTFQVRDSLFAGPGGFLKFESTWQVTDGGLRLTTAIPMGGS